MPWEIKTGLAGCEGFAVTKRGDSKVLGCHTSRGAAERQVAALYASEPEAYAKSLDDSGLLKAHNVTHGQELSSAVVQLHHLIVQEMCERGIKHDSVDCELHKAVVLKSELVLPLEKAQELLKGQPSSSAVHVNTLISNQARRKKKKPYMDDEEDDMEKYDKPGHPFRGNQWSAGSAGGGSSADERNARLDAIRQERAKADEEEEKRVDSLKQDARKLVDSEAKVSTKSRGDYVGDIVEVGSKKLTIDVPRGDDSREIELNWSQITSVTGVGQ